MESRVICGSAAETDSSSYDLVVLSPGIDPDSPLAQNFSSRNIETIGELELGWRSCQHPGHRHHRDERQDDHDGVDRADAECVRPTHHCLRKYRQTAVRGRAPSRSKFDVLTVEVSSFQLETIRTFRPAISLWLNFAPDHLDRYSSVAEYRAAKLRIFDNQTADDVAIVNANEELPAIAARTLTFSAYADQRGFSSGEGGAIVYQNEPVLRLAETKLRGSAQHREPDGAHWLSVMTRGLTFAQMVAAA